jgi:uncharacterized cupredoxin-like copper-binding protein
MTAKALMSVLVVGLVASACGGQQSGDSGGQEPATIEVQAEDFKFGGVPQTVPAGEARFVMENVGQEPHDFGLVRITTDTPIDELIQLPQQQANQQIEQVGNAFAKPGKTATLETDLTAGRYGYACFVETNGKPHAFLGMVGEFQVT